MFPMEIWVRNGSRHVKLTASGLHSVYEFTLERFFHCPFVCLYWILAVLKYEGFLSRVWISISQESTNSLKIFPNMIVLHIQLLGFRTLSIFLILNNCKKSLRSENWICFRPQVRGDTYSVKSLVQWFRLALSKGHTRVGVSPHLKTKTYPVSGTLCFTSNYLESGRWTKSKNPVILCVIHPRQKSIESTWLYWS
jgi:hypothetical protein